MKSLIVFCIATIFVASGCLQHPIHQGNELSKEKVGLIQKGDSKFQVESALGSPAMLDPLDPNRVEYVEQVKDKDKKENYVRGVIVEYDQALRVKNLQYFGF